MKKACVDIDMTSFVSVVWSDLGGKEEEEQQQRRKDWNALYVWNEREEDEKLVRGKYAQNHHVCQENVLRCTKPEFRKLRPSLSTTISTPPLLLPHQSKNPPPLPPQRQNKHRNQRHHQSHPRHINHPMVITTPTPSPRTSPAAPSSIDKT